MTRYKNPTLLCTSSFSRDFIQSKNLVNMKRNKIRIILFSMTFTRFSDRWYKIPNLLFTHFHRFRKSRENEKVQNPNYFNFPIFTRFSSIGKGLLYAPDVDGEIVKFSLFVIHHFSQNQIAFGTDTEFIVGQVGHTVFDSSVIGTINQKCAYYTIQWDIFQHLKLVGMLQKGQGCT